MERMEQFAQPLIEFIQAHQNWAIAVMFITAFGESFAFLSLLFPGTTLLIAAGTLVVWDVDIFRDGAVHEQLLGGICARQRVRVGDNGFGSIDVFPEVLKRSGRHGGLQTKGLSGSHRQSADPINSSL
jgi:hypothetical protein